MEAQSTVKAQLVSTEELETLLAEGGVKVLDSTWKLPEDLNPAAEFETEHIEGARFFNIDAMSPEGSLRATLPTEEIFKEHMKKLGVKRTDKIVVYDTHLFSVCRGWYMLTVMGATDVSVLNGGFPKWKSEDRAIGAGAVADVNLEDDDGQDWSFDKSRFQDIEGVYNTISDIKSGDKTTLLVDPRPEAMYATGSVSETLNAQFTLMMEENKEFKSKEEILQVFKDAGVDGAGQKITFSCGKGITACNTDFLWRYANDNSADINTNMYAGSFSEFKLYEEPDYSSDAWKENFALKKKEE